MVRLGEREARANAFGCWQAYGVVTCPAKVSFVGRTAALVMSSNEEGHFQVVLNGIGTTLLIIVFAFIFAGAYRCAYGTRALLKN